MRTKRHIPPDVDKFRVVVEETYRRIFWFLLLFLFIGGIILASLVDRDVYNRFRDICQDQPTRVQVYYDCPWPGSD